jgi:hypothetical protein
MLSHGGRNSYGINKDTTFVVIGNKPGRIKVDKADKGKIPLITYKTLLSQFEGKTTVPELRFKPRPDISAFLEGRGPSLSPPVIQWDQTSGKGIMFSNLKPVKKHQEIPKTPEWLELDPSMENLLPTKEV